MIPRSPSVPETDCRIKSFVSDGHSLKIHNFPKQPDFGLFSIQKPFFEKRAILLRFSAYISYGYDLNHHRFTYILHFTYFKTIAF